MKSILWKISAAVTLLILGLSALLAQETRGTITGRVTDKSGAVIPGVEVTATNLDTGIKASGKSNAQGDYVLPFLLTGRYSIAAEVTGFKRFLQPEVVVRINDRLQIDVEMEIGQQAEQVTVSSETPLLETRTASMGQVIDRQWLNDLPILHANPMLLIQLAPGVVNTNSSTTWVSTSAGANANHTQSTMGGSSTSTQEITLDGASNTTTSAGVASTTGKRTVAFIPPADLVSEFKVQVAGFDASEGFTTGGSVAMALKSGTNSLHGSALYSRTNTGWNANDFFANRVGQPRAKLFSNHEVITGSGPVYIPRVYDGRNKTFFLYGWEREMRSAPFAGAMFSVPTEAQRQGDLSGLLKVNPTYQIYDPYSAKQEGSRIVRAPFPDNIVPKSLINPTAQKILPYYPAPLTAGLADGQQNYPQPNLLSVVTLSSHTGRIDHMFGEKHRVFFRSYWGERPALANDNFGNLATGVWSNFANRGAMFDEVWTLSPNLVTNLRYSFTRFAFALDPKSQGMDLSTLGFSPNLVGQIDPTIASFPTITVSGLTTLGQNNGAATYTNTHAFAGQVSWAKGSHILKFGAEHRRYQTNNFDRGNISPALTFGTDYTKAHSSSTASPGGVGQAFAAFLLGLPSAGTVEKRANYAQSSPATGLFVQDDWRLTSKLTLNLGLRYEVEGALSERFDRTVRGFDATTINAMNDQVSANYARSPLTELPASQFVVKGGLLYAGVGGQPHTLYNTPKTNFAPRVGFAYQLLKNTVLRGGYGVFYGFLGQQSGLAAIQTGFSQGTPYVASLDGGLTFAANLTNPFPGGVIQPRGNSAGLNTYVGNGVAFFNTDPRTPTNQIWSFSVQRQLSGDSMFEIGYIGNHGTYLQTQTDFQYFRSQYLSRSPVRDQNAVNYWTTNMPNPFYPLLPGTGLAAQVVSRERVARMANFPQFTSASMRDNDGLSSYHALIARFSKRFGSSFTMQANYTWSKLIQATSRLNGPDTPLERVIAGDDRPQNFAFNAIYRLPFGTGRTFTTDNKILNHVIRDWVVGGILTLQGGQALGFGNSLLAGGLNEIAVPGGDRTIDRWFNTAAFNRNVTEQLSYNYRTLSTRLSGVRGPGVNIWNASLLKTVPISERLRFEVKADVANLFNHPNFANPNTSPTATAFGKITGTTAFARVVQLGGKLQW